MFESGVPCARIHVMNSARRQTDCLFKAMRNAFLEPHGSISIVKA